MNKSIKLLIVLAIIAGFSGLSVSIFAQSGNNMIANLTGKWTLVKIPRDQLSAEKEMVQLHYTKQ